MFKVVVKKVLECMCERCGHKWVGGEVVSKTGLMEDDWIKPPTCCAKCKSPYWDSKRKGKTK